MRHLLLIRIFKTHETHDVARRCSHTDVGQRSLLLTLPHLQVVLFQLSGFKGIVAQPAAGCPLWACVLLLHERNWMSRQSKDSQEPLSLMLWLLPQRDSQTWTSQCGSHLAFPTSDWQPQQVLWVLHSADDMSPLPHVKLYVIKPWRPI